MGRCSEYGAISIDMLAVALFLCGIVISAKILRRRFHGGYFYG